MDPVILPDTNVWIALTLPLHSSHKAAMQWLAKKPPYEHLAFCTLTQLSYLRLLTTDAVMRTAQLAPLSNAEAWQRFEVLQASVGTRWVSEPGNFTQTWKRLSARS